MEETLKLPYGSRLPPYVLDYNPVIYEGHIPDFKETL